MKHFICTGECEGVSDQPGTCQSKECSLHNQPLVECKCTDGKHKEIKANHKKL
jgi:hypothetical protein